jgi:hypothetical protein
MLSALPRSVQVHHVLFGLVALLAFTALPHAFIVFDRHLPAALLNVHLTALIVLSIHAELRRQWWKRMKAQRDLMELVNQAGGPRT